MKRIVELIAKSPEPHSEGEFVSALKLPEPSINASIKLYLPLIQASGCEPGKKYSKVPVCLKKPIGEQITDKIF